jgi:hypothetical protein
MPFLFTIREQAIQIFALASWQALLPPIGIFGRHDPLDRAKAIIDAPGSIVEIIEQLFVARGQRLRRFPLRHVVKD